MKRNLSEQSAGRASSEGGELLPRQEAEGVPERAGAWFLVVVSVAMGLASLAAGWVFAVSEDSVFYLHTWWLYAQGYVPYRDFYGGTPGIWILLAPVAWLPWTPSAWLIFGRTLMAVLFGGSFYLVGRLVRAKGWETLLMGCLAGVIMLRTEWFLFRRSYFEVFFLIVHLVLLERLIRKPRVGWLSFWAGVTIGTAFMISQRGIFYLPIQPAVLLIFLWKEREKFLSALIGWLGGLAVACCPTIFYCAYHNLWAELWEWEVVFPKTVLQPYGYSWSLILKTLLRGGVGLLAWSLLSYFDSRIPSDTKKFLAIAWLGVVAGCLLNPNILHYSEGGLRLLLAGLLSCVPRVFLDRMKWSILGKSLLQGTILTGCVLLTGIFIQGYVIPHVDLVHEFHVRKAQLNFLDWLAKIVQQEEIVSFAPHHPMLVPDRTFLQGGGIPIMAISSPQMRKKLENFAEQILEAPPPLVIAKPFPERIQGKDLFDWLWFHHVLSLSEVHELRQMIVQHYVQVTFPLIREGRFPTTRIFPSQVDCYGDTFWIRRDRFEACPPPDIPHQVQKPTFPSAKPSASPPPSDP